MDFTAITTSSITAFTGIITSSIAIWRLG
jgi:hypothetical protein